MSLINTIIEKARGDLKCVAFPEATEEKILLAARDCVDRKICNPLLVGDEDEIINVANKLNISLENIDIYDTFNEVKIEKLINLFFTINTIFSVKSLKRKSKDPMYVALMLQAVGDVDITFAGLIHTTGDVIIGGQTMIGFEEGCSTISSVAIFDVPGYQGSEGNLLAFGDSAVCVNPNADELADIAISACNTVNSLLGWEPRCAMLSYSTCGSSEGELVEKVVKATKIANDRRPDLKIDGEFQLDSAINPVVARKKVKKESFVAGKANIIIWPDLNVGNIGVKLVQEFAKANAYGPMLQGFKKIVCDCSRGASVSDMVGNIAMSCVRARGVK